MGEEEIARDVMIFNRRSKRQLDRINNTSKIGVEEINLAKAMSLGFGNKNDKDTTTEVDIDTLICIDKEDLVVSDVGQVTYLPLALLRAENPTDDSFESIERQSELSSGINSYISKNIEAFRPLIEASGHDYNTVCEIDNFPWNQEGGVFIPAYARKMEREVRVYIHGSVYSITPPRVRDKEEEPIRLKCDGIHCDVLFQRNRLTDDLHGHTCRLNIRDPRRFLCDIDRALSAADCQEMFNIETIHIVNHNSYKHDKENPQRRIWDYSHVPNVIKSLLDHFPRHHVYLHRYAEKVSGDHIVPILVATLISANKIPTDSIYHWNTDSGYTLHSFDDVNYQWVQTEDSRVHILQCTDPPLLPDNQEMLGIWLPLSSDLNQNSVKSIRFWYTDFEDKVQWHTVQIEQPFSVETIAKSIVEERYNDKPEQLCQIMIRRIKMVSFYGFASQ